MPQRAALSFAAPCCWHNSRRAKAVNVGIEAVNAAANAAANDAPKVALVARVVLVVAEADAAAA